MKFKNYKVAVYLRTAHKDNSAIEKQKKLIDFYCRTKGYPKIVNTYQDNGYSGTTENRPAFKKMLKDIKKGKINAIVVTDISRLTRQPILFYHKMNNYIVNEKLIIIDVLDNKLFDFELFNLVSKEVLNLKTNGGVI